MARQLFVRYSSQCFYLTHMIQHFFMIGTEYLREPVLGDFKYLASTFYVFMYKFFCVISPIFEIQ